MNKLIIAAALAATALPLPAAAQTTATVAASTAEIRLDHISIVKLGSGPPVVLIPGLASPRVVWDAVAPDLARRHTVYLVQVNGFGGDAPGANLAPGILESIVADLSGYLGREKAGPVRLVGHSMGGLAGLMFARKHPGQVDRLMIVDALPFFAVLLARGGEEPTATSIEPVARIMRERIAARHGQPVTRETVREDVGGLALKPESRAKMEAWAVQADPRVTGQLLYEDMTTDLRPALSGIRTPLTVVVPWSQTAFGRDRTLAFYARQYAGAPNIAFVDIGEAGHFTMLDQPEKFREALDTFVK